MNSPPLTNVSASDRLVALQQRQKTTDILVQKIQVNLCFFVSLLIIFVLFLKMLRERLTRKEELLRDYEKDLSKLRQAEILLREKDVLLQDLEVKP